MSQGLSCHHMMFGFFDVRSGFIVKASSQTIFDGGVVVDQMRLVGAQIAGAVEILKAEIEAVAHGDQLQQFVVVGIRRRVFVERDEGARGHGQADRFGEARDNDFGDQRQRALRGAAQLDEI